MGSANSSPGSGASAMDNSRQGTATQRDCGAEEMTPQHSRRREPPSHLKGIQLVEWKCKKKKKTWSECVGSWYGGRFLPGQALEEEEADCDDLFEAYRHCFMRGMLKERQKKGLDPPKEGTLLAEFLEEEATS